MESNPSVMAPWFMAPWPGTQYRPRHWPVVRRLRKRPRRAVKLRAQVISFTPKSGGPFGQPVRLSKSYLSDLTIGQDFLEALLRLVRWLPSQARFGHGHPLMQDQLRAEGASR